MKMCIVCVTGVVLSIGASAGAQTRVEHNFRDRDSMPLATRAPYPAGRADDVRRPGFNGKEWRGESFVGGRNEWPMASRDPGPAAYGAVGDEGAVVYALVGQTVVAFSPWERVEGSGNRQLEYARQKWLERYGYVGGVRTFTNDTIVHHDMASAEKKEIVPRAIITVPIDIPRFKGHQEVKTDSKPGTTAVAANVAGESKAGEKLKISWPMGAPKDAVARTNKPEDTKIATKHAETKDAKPTDGVSVASAEK